MLRKQNVGGRFRFFEHERLKGKQVIKEIFSKGRRFRRGNLTLIYLSSEEPKVCIVASRSVGGAVKRNRVKRKLREAYRMHKAIFKEYKVVLYAQGMLDFRAITDAFRSFEESEQ